jgi:hypothetical protein
MGLAAALLLISGEIKIVAIMITVTTAIVMAEAITITTAIAVEIGAVDIYFFDRSKTDEKVP